MEGILFFGIVILIAFILWKRGSGTEGFQDTAPDGASPGPVIPLISPREQTLLKGEVKPFAEPSTALLAPPPGQLASVGSRPASDPASEKASGGRIQSVLESLKGFFAREAPGLSKLGDPSVQLPLTTAKADRGRLEDELAVLKRNPGLESSMTVEDINGVEANLGYLQKKWRLSANALSGASPMPGAEGFQDAGVAANGPSGIVGWFTSLFSSEEGVPGTAEGFQGTTSTTGSTTTPSSTTTTPSSTTTTPSSTTTTPSSTTTTPSSTTTSTTGSDMKITDLKDLSAKINVEIVRLSASGTTDANITARIDVLSTIKKTIDDLIREVEAGRRAEKDIPIKKADVTKFLPAMSNLNSGIPELITGTGGNPILNSLFSKYAAGDLSGAQVAQKMFEQYATDFMKNLSYDVNLRFKYTGDAEKKVALNYAQAMADAKFVAENSSGAAGPAAAPGSAAADKMNPAVNAAYRGFFQNVIEDSTGGKVESVEVGHGGMAEDSAASSAGAAAQGKQLEKFNWKERSKQICEQVATRGYSPKEFGCMDDPDTLKRDGFSWRGYTRMVCARLATIYEPGIPELCGCPPPTWPGWRP